MSELKKQRIQGIVCSHHVIDNSIKTKDVLPEKVKKGMWVHHLVILSRMIMEFAQFQSWDRVVDYNPNNKTFDELEYISGKKMLHLYGGQASMFIDSRVKMKDTSVRDHFLYSGLITTSPEDDPGKRDGEALNAMMLWLPHRKKRK